MANTAPTSDQAYVSGHLPSVFNNKFLYLEVRNINPPPANVHQSEVYAVEALSLVNTDTKTVIFSVPVPAALGRLNAYGRPTSTWEDQAKFNEAERRYLYKEFLGATQLGESLLVATSSGLVFLKATTGEEEKTWVEKKTGQNDLFLCDEAEVTISVNDAENPARAYKLEQVRNGYFLADAGNYVVYFNGATGLLISKGTGEILEEVQLDSGMINRPKPSAVTAECKFTKKDVSVVVKGIVYL